MIDTRLEQVGAVMSRDGSREFALYKGINSSSIDALIAFSKGQDEAVAKFTSDPKRFGSLEAVDKWLAKGRTIYTLEQPEEHTFTGIVWFGQEWMPKAEEVFPSIDPSDYGITFAIRLYEAARGKGLATPFMKETFAHFMTTPEYQGLPNPNFWLETSDDNIPAVSAYTKFGFEHASTPDAHNKILMVHKPVAMFSVKKQASEL